MGYQVDVITKGRLVEDDSLRRVAISLAGRRLNYYLNDTNYVWRINFIV